MKKPVRYKPGRQAINLPALLPDKPTREDIDALQARMLASPAAKPPTAYPVDELLFAGMYVRAVTIPAGDVIAGAAHNEDHINFLMGGSIEVWTVDGRQELHAPDMIPSRAGVKRIGRALTDVLWATVHRTDAQTAAEAVAALVTSPTQEIPPCPSSS